MGVELPLFRSGWVAGCARRQAVDREHRQSPAERRPVLTHKKIRIRSDPRGSVIAFFLCGVNT